MKNKFAICFNDEISGYIDVVSKLEFLLQDNSLVYSKFNVNNLSSYCDFVFVIGGDGTILKAARYYSSLDVPIFGINIGHLGFLSQASDNNLESAFFKIINNDYKIENRVMLTCGDNIALNDFVIKGSEASRASKFSLQINNKFVCDYFADGLIISTPTGSTAYGMASGGPILSPETDAIEIVPICPHTFSARPIVVPSDSEIKISAKNNQKYCVSADGQIVFESSDNLIIRKSDYCAKLVLLDDNDFFSVLRNKLNWGFSPISEINKGK